MFTLIAFGESQDGAAAYHYVAAVIDPHITVVGDIIYVPTSMPYIIGKACLSAADAALVAARLCAPSLERVCKPSIAPIVNAETFGSPPEMIYHPLSPTPLQGNEGLRAEINSDDSAGDNEYVLVWLSDGQQTPVQGDIYSIRATSAITLAENTWVYGALTWDQDIPVGVYNVVGMRAQGTNLIAARMVVPGMFNRPGVAAVNALGDLDPQITRYGRMGVFGQFDSVVGFGVECLGITDTSQEYIFDLVKVG